MDPSSVHIKEMLTADVAVDTTNNPIHIGEQPSKPNNCITIVDYGAGAQLTLTMGEGYDLPSLQVRVRAVDYVEGWNLIESIKKSLHGRANESLHGTYYALIRCLNGPAFLQLDENRRVHFVANFSIQRCEC